MWSIEYIRQWTGVVLVALSVSASTGCAPIQPWERDRLAHDCMQMPVDPSEAAFDGHVQLVREGSQGGASEGGGGCGCN